MAQKNRVIWASAEETREDIYTINPDSRFEHPQIASPDRAGEDSTIGATHRFPRPGSVIVKAF